MSGDMIYLVDRKTLQFLDVNDTAWLNHGMTREEMMRGGVLPTVAPETREEVEKRYDRLIIEGGTSRVEREVSDHQGHQVFLETYSRASCIDGNWIIIGVTRNITRRKRMEETTQKLHRMYSSLSETNAASLRAVSVESLYHSVCDAALKGGRFTVACIFALDADGRNLRPVAYAGNHTDALLSISIPTDPTELKSQGLIGSAFHSARACISNDFLSDTRTAPWHEMGAAVHIASAAAFPLLCDDEPVAVLLFYAAETRVFNDEMVTLLQSMADNVSFALDNFRNEKQRQEAEEILRESEERFRSLTHLSSDFYWEMDAQFHMQLYEGRILGDSNLRAVAAMKGHCLWEVEGVVCTSHSWEEFRRKLYNHERFKDLEISFTNSEGVVYHLSMSGEPVFNNKQVFKGYRGISRDVTERRRIADHIKYLATHDNLTGLPNRTKFTELLGTSARLAERYKDRAFALFFIDVDRFKKVNDTYGHHTGDELLKEIARRLKTPLRTTDIVARLGGDEFVILLNGVKDRAAISTVAGNVLAAFKGGVMIGTIHCDISVSIGISVYGEDADSEESLLRHADAAMYIAKEMGKDNFHFYQESLPLSEAAQAS